MSGKETTKIDLFDDSFTLKVVKEIIKDDKMKLNTHKKTPKKPPKKPKNKGKKKKKESRF